MNPENSHLALHLLLLFRLAGPSYLDTDRVPAIDHLLFDINKTSPLCETLLAFFHFQTHWFDILLAFLHIQSHWYNTPVALDLGFENWHCHGGLVALALYFPLLGIVGNFRFLQQYFYCLAESLVFLSFYPPRSF